MKRIMYCFLLLTGLPAGLSAQQFYAGIGTGYGFAAGKTILGQNLIYDGNSIEKENVYGSYGAGFTGSVYAGYQFTDKYGFEISGEYLQGKKYELTNLYPGNTDQPKFVFSHRAESWRICPSFRVNLGKKKLNYFLKAGVLLGIRTRFYDSSVFYYSYGTDVLAYENDAFLTLGLQMVSGINYHFNEHWSVFTSLNINGANWSADKGRMVQNDKSGTNLLNSTLPSYYEYIFVKDPENIYSYTNPDGIGVRKKVNLPMSSVGFGFGIEYQFGKAAE